MKHYKLFILLFISIELCGQNKKEYSIHFNSNDFVFEKADSLVHISSTNDDYVIWGDTINPALPCIGINILIAPYESYQSVSERCNEVLVLSDAIIEPNPISFPTNSLQLSTKRRYVKYTSDSYPEEGIEYTGTHMVDGYKFLSFVVCPFRYDAMNKLLYLKKDVTIKLQLSQLERREDIYKNESQEPFGYNMYDWLKNNILNEDEIGTLYQYHQRERGRTSQIPYEYIIITNETLKPVFEKLAHWKTIKGIRSNVITVEDCCDEYPNYTPQLAVKTVLSNYYYNGMTYALLGGDTDVVPTQICYLPNRTTDTSDTPADLYYSCLDDCFSWDGNGNQVYGEMSDSIDLVPEFIITRAPVSSTTEAETFVNRIIEYESSPKMEGWTSKMLSCGNLLSGYYTQNNGQISDAQYKGEYVYRYGVQDYWSGDLFELFDTYTSHVNGASYDADGNHFQIELEKGYTFVDEISHGWANKWGFLENETIYDLNKASSLTNNGYSIITTSSCYTNAFDKISTDFNNETDYYTTCLSESFVRNPYSGVLAYFGSSREGWTGYSYYFDMMFYKKLLTGNDKQFARAAMAAKNYYLKYVNTYNYNNYRWLIMTLNSIGDPEMPIFTETPQIFNNVSVDFSSGDVSVSTNVPYCRICVSSVADYGESYYEVSDSTSNAYFSGVDEDCYLCITKAGYVPYVARVGPCVYLQNETITRHLPIFSSTTYAGLDVTSSKPEGPVIIQKGKVTNQSQGSMTIENNFEVQLGAELEIQN